MACPVSDAQFAALMGALVGVGGAFVKLVHWFGTRAVVSITAAFDRVVKSLDDNTSATREIARSQIEHAAQVASSQATVAAKLDHIADWVHEHTPVEPHPPPQAVQYPPSERRRRLDVIKEVTPTELPPGGRYHHSKRRS